MMGYSSQHLFGFTLWTTFYDGQFTLISNRVDSVGGDLPREANSSVLNALTCPYEPCMLPTEQLFASGTRWCRLCALWQCRATCTECRTIMALFLAFGITLLSSMVYLHLPVKHCLPSFSRLSMIRGPGNVLGAP